MTTKHTQKVRWLDNGLIYGPYMTLCTNEDMFNAALRHLKIPKTNWPSFMVHERADATCHKFINDGKMACIITLPKPPKTATKLQVISLLVHEATHVWQMFRDEIGETSPSYEFEAYSIQSISQELINAAADQLGWRGIK